MKKIKFLLLSIASLLTLAFSGTVAVMADSSDCTGSAKDVIGCGVNNAAGNNGPSSQATSNLNHTIKTVINLLSVAVGIIAVIMLIVGGFRYVTSGGNDAAIGAAKKTIFFALIGLVVVALAQVIAKFALHEVTSGTKSSLELSYLLHGVD